MDFAIVAAVAANGVIGADGDIPWHYPADLEHFKRTTTGHPVIMGRRTFASIKRHLGGPLPDRSNIVLTNQVENLPRDITAVSSIPAAVEEAERGESETAYVVGGATVYEQFLPQADELILTELDSSYDGDTTFPSVDWSRWLEEDRRQHEEFDIVRYVCDTE